MTKIRKEQISSGVATDGQVLTADGAGEVDWEDAPGGTDDDAIHDNVASEIHAITEKASPVDDDEILIEDSADSYNKKRVKISNLPSSGDMTKAVYDTDDDGSVDEADAIDGVDAAGNSKYYGTDGTGTPGFHNLPSGGAVDAGDVTYTPLVNADWDSDSDPGDVDNALDQLAERVDDLEASGGSGETDVLMVQVFT